MLITAVVMGALMLVARICEFITSILIGMLVQKTCLKHGQYRSWLLYGPFIVAIGTTLCFINPGIPMMAKAVIVFVGYLLYGAGMSCVQLSQNGLMSKIAGPNMAYRITITGKLSQGNWVGTIIASFISMPLIILVDRMGVDGYSVIQAILAFIGVLGQLPLFFLTKEFEQYDPGFKNIGGGDNFVSVFIETLKNRQLLVLLIADAFRWASYMTVMALGIYYFSYVAQNMAMLATAMTTQSVFGFLGTIAGPPVAKKLGKKPSGILTGILCTVFFAGIMFGGEISPIVYIACVSAALFSMGIINACGANLYLDCGEYQYYRTGKDNRTFTMSFYGNAIKIGLALSSVAIAALLNASGYDGATNTVADIHRMVLLIGGILAGLNLLYTLLMAGYRITEQKSKEYAEHNFKASTLPTAGA
jgi:Na+/melibiose symporter-like transporter